MKIYRLKSESTKDLKYLVRYFEGTDKWVCECPAFGFGKKGYQCKHIQKAIKYVEEKTK